jgi:molybdopterin molybdotransferase
VSTALEQLVRGLPLLNIETLPLSDAYGRFLAEDVRCTFALPGCDNSAMDGYTVRTVDCAIGAATLPIAAEARAGDPVGQHAAGTATRIMTGAPVPQGADAVVRLEDTIEHNGRVDFHVDVEPGQNIRRAGEDARPGDLLLAVGRPVRSVDIGACAAAGLSFLPVRRRPRVAVLAGGDELR